jgi:hypothetical protein
MLVTELFFHALRLCEAHQLYVAHGQLEKLSRMMNFIAWCTPHHARLVLIGDHDSGSLIHKGLKQQTIVAYKTVQNSPVAHFERFGLSVIKTEKWHITLRHLAYRPRQVTGHFHNDFGSITLAHNGVNILVDPGSYVYTPSVPWRNTFRSVTMHNSFFLEGVEPISLSEKLFFLDLPPTKMALQDLTGAVLQTEHALYKQFGLTFKRTVTFDELGGAVTLHDSFVPVDQQQRDYPNTRWNFTLAPDISASLDGGAWVFEHNGKPIMTMESPDLTFAVNQSWVSLEYGRKEKTTSLRAVKPIIPNKVVTITIYSAL